MSYLDSLVCWSLFVSVEAGFLPVGHTNSDIDQAFSSTSNRFPTHDALKLVDMQAELKQCYNQHPVVTDLKQIMNWSGLCDEVGCCNNIVRITQFRFSRFTRVTKGLSTGASKQLHMSKCEVKCISSDASKPFEEAGSKHFFGPSLPPSHRLHRNKHAPLQVSRSILRALNLKYHESMLNRR